MGRCKEKAKNADGAAIPTGTTVGDVPSADAVTPSASNHSSARDVEAQSGSFGSTGKSEQAPLVGGDAVNPLTKIGQTFRDDVKKEPLGENIFSLIYVAKTFSVAFTMSVTVAIMQILMLFLALMDLVDVNDDENPLRVPNDVSLPVRLTGVACLLLSVAQFWDFMSAIEKLQQGQPPRTEETPDSATCL